MDAIWQKLGLSKPMTSDSSMRAVITGATGFVGVALCRSLLGRNHEVVALARRASDTSVLGSFEGLRVEILPGEAGDLSALMSQIEPTVVFHLATEYTRGDDVDLSRVIDGNLLVGAWVLAATVAIQPSPKFVFAGSFFQHFGGDRPINLYAATKTAFRSMVDYYADAHGLCTAEVVLSDLYGRGSRRLKLVDRAIEAALTGTELRIPEGATVLQLLHVDDAVRALEASAQAIGESDQYCGARWFASPDSAMSVPDVIGVVEKLVGRPINTSRLPLDLPPRRMERLVTGPRPPGWIPRVDIESGIAGMIP